MNDSAADMILPMLTRLHDKMGEISLKLDILAQGQVGIRKEMNEQGKRIDQLTSRVDQLSLHIQEVSIAVDAHTSRLDRIEHHLGLDAKKH